MHVLEPGWEVPDTLPAGVTVAPAADPKTAARVIAERIGGELVVDVAAAERLLAREASRRRAAQVVADAAEAARLCARLDELAVRTARDRADCDERSREVARLAAVVGDVTAEPYALTGAAARLRAARLTAEAAARVVGERPSTVAAEMELVRARSLVTEVPERSHASASATAGALAMSAGAALLLVSAAVPVLVLALLLVLVVAALVGRHRRARLVDLRLRAEADAAAAAAERAYAAWTRAVGAAREWQLRADAAAAADAELAAAQTAWVDVVGSEDVPVERADVLAAARVRLVEIADALGVDRGAPATQLAFELRRRVDESADAARAREEAQARLRELLHGRRLDRLQAEAAAARDLLAAPAPPAIVLCEPFAAVGRHRRRELFEGLERAASGVTLAVVTSDDEALAWAAARIRTDLERREG